MSPFSMFNGRSDGEVDEVSGLLSAPIPNGGSSDGKAVYSGRSWWRLLWRSGGEGGARDGKTTMALTACNFMNGVVGAGILGLPGALNEAGFVMGICFCILVAVLSAWTIRLLAEVGSMHGVFTYQDLASRAFGNAGYYIVCLFTFLFAFGAMCSYLVIFADTVPAVLREIIPNVETDHPAAIDRTLVLAVGSVLVLLPLCFLRRFSELAKFSIIKLFAITFLTATVVYFKYDLTPEIASVKSDEWKYEDVHASPFPALGTIAFAFVCHHQTFLALGSLRQPTLRRFTITINMAVTGSFAVSIVMAIAGEKVPLELDALPPFAIPSLLGVGVIIGNFNPHEPTAASRPSSCQFCVATAAAGYTTFWETTKGDVFLNYESFVRVRSSGLMNTARLFVALNMLITYPSEMMVARNIIEALIERRRKHLRWLALKAPVHDVVLLAQLRQSEELDALESADNWRCGTWPTRSVVVHVLITLLLYGGTLGIAVGVTSLNKVLNFTGSFTAVFLAFVLPAAIRLRLGAHPYDDNKLLHISNLPAMIVLVFGVIAFLASTGLSILNAI